jgi:cytochrome c-type biogenesis protein CcmH
MRRFSFAIILVMALGQTALAVEADELLKDPALEARARKISSELRCLVCQNESIDDSHAQLARDLRVLVREKLSAGASDAEVMGYVTDRYGDFVLLRPRFTGQTLLLWLGPFALLGVIIAMLWPRRRPDLAQAGLSADENARVRQMLDDGPPSG